MDNENQIKEIERLVNAAGEARSVDNHPYLLVPDGMSVQDLEHLLPAPLRIRTSSAFIALESFTRYVNSFKTDATAISVTKKGDAIATIDASKKDAPAWHGHNAQFHVTYSDRWTLWDGRTKKGFTQRELAEFVEDNTTDFFKPEAGAMLDIARSLEIEQNSKATNAIKDFKTGDVSFSFERTTTAKAGTKGDATVPSQFTIQIPILEGEKPRPVEIRLRFELEEGKVRFNLEILRRTQLLDEVRRSIFATIKNETSIEPFLVA